ncbi:uncharacterized protein KQ657_005162 [Scheffersomyces spartinae]|uniref:Uncharacterized protein n=1 Tax=Scheffersomyces spartinae TaxID=45513 RepID=A0A9P8AI26_9ASCO|nr:uncharacterized protein KQ657_005162 [Scheffersomyces spartinae]KAG7193963.1 hypothetical protein KQ657_005162 [Scheffersomyces spartinae]
MDDLELIVLDSSSEEGSISDGEIDLEALVAKDHELLNTGTSPGNINTMQQSGYIQRSSSDLNVSTDSPKNIPIDSDPNASRRPVNNEPIQRHPLSIQGRSMPPLANGRLDSLKHKSVPRLDNFDFKFNNGSGVPLFPKYEYPTKPLDSNIISLTSDSESDTEMEDVSSYRDNNTSNTTTTNNNNGHGPNAALLLSLPNIYSSNQSSVVLINGDAANSPGMRPPNVSGMDFLRKVSDDDDDDDDDEIVILDPQAAEKSTHFKKSTFEMYPQSPPPQHQHQQSSFMSSMPGLFPPDQGSVHGHRQLHNVPVAVPHVNEAFAQEEAARRELQVRLSMLEEERSGLALKIPAFNSAIKSALQLFQAASIQFESIRIEKTNARKNGLKSLVKSIQSKYDQVERDYNKAQSEYTRVSLELDTIKRRKSSLDNQCFQLRRKLEFALNSAASQFRNSLFNNQQAAVAAPVTYVPNIYSAGNEQLTEPEMKAWMSKMYDEEDLDDSKLPQTPKEMKVKLMKHQRRGLAWLVEMEKSTFKGGILADDMGLGKTVQTIALILHNKAQSTNRRASLVIAPVSLLRQWALEIESKINQEFQLTVGVFHGKDKKLLKTFSELNKYDIVLTSYGTLASEWKKHFKEAIEESKVTKRQNVLPDLNSGGRSYVSPFYAKDAVFNRVILDEAQAIKNKLSMNAKSVTCLKAEYRFILTGTPMQNSVGELYPFFRFLKARPYNNEERFNHEIAMPLKITGPMDTPQRDLSLKKLRAILRALVLRRTKDSKIDGKPILQLPPLNITSEGLVMEKEEDEYYSGLQSDIQAKAKELLSEKKLDVGSGILTLLLRLRQACCHRFLVDVGMMNAAEKQNMELSKGVESKITKKCYEVKGLRQQVVDAITKEYRQEEEDGMFSCPICTMLNTSSSMLIFNKCGHMICQDCVDDFFDRYLTLDGGSDSSRKASCMSCQTEVEETKMIPHSMFFDLMVKRLPMEEVIQLQISSSTSTTTLTKEKIEELIKANNGMMIKSAKMTKTLELVKDIMKKNPEEKIIVFSQFLVSFEVLALMLKESNVDFLRYDGTMTIDEKNKTVKLFYQLDIPVLLLSLKAGNVGLTLTCASQVILMEPFWNPFPEEQAIGRAHRIGQNRNVQVYRLFTPGTVEARIVELQKQKKELADAALDEDGLKSISRLGRQELGFLFGFNSLEPAA